MKRKIFKYKSVYIYHLIITLIFIFSFSFFLISFMGIITIGKEEKFTDSLAKYLGIIVLISSIISFFLLIEKNKKTILLLNLNTLFVGLFLILLIFTARTEGIYDITAIIIFLLLFSFIGLTFFLINFYRYKPIKNEIADFETPQ
ncbi:hypothetical protein [Chryseobacterium sp.]|uniref:hypothetical protein n=1 Tax=Chryseobacterium sp. TaxID=1871047 RepID=UPI0011C8EBB9|nr:hypothetical protein [Chryseobacterium sp.]TXF79187.1 hypothetical protein FUA25_01985 [Chryseobacterium sp.]